MSHSVDIKNVAKRLILDEAKAVQGLTAYIDDDFEGREIGRASCRERV